MEAEDQASDQIHRLPRALRLAFILLGLLGLVAGLAIGSFLLIGMLMSAGHGCDPVPDLHTGFLLLLPVLLIAFGVVGLVCTTLKRLAVMVVMFSLIVADLAVLVQS